jgi:ATP-binding cassette subfamily B protein
MIISGFMMLAMMMQFMIRGIASIQRINEVLNTKTVINSGEVKKGKEEGTVEFKNVSFSYPRSEEGERVLQNVSFKINKGETIGILGATGSGKTSLVNLITRFYDATEGEVFVNDINVKEYDLNALREDIVTMVLQKAELFSGTIKDNIGWGKKDASMEEIIEASKIAQAHDFISGFENGYDTIVAEKGASLSGGQKQRISIARALIRKPEILIFDDSTSALDLKTEANLYKDLNEKMSDTTVIIIAQRVASVKNADKILIINDGIIEAFGPHEELINTSETYIEIYNSQLKRGDD